MEVVEAVEDGLDFGHSECLSGTLSWAPEYLGLAGGHGGNMGNYILCTFRIKEIPYESIPMDTL